MILFRTEKGSSQPGKNHFFRIVIFPDWPIAPVGVKMALAL